MTRVYKFSLIFYRVVLILTIPVYLLLYGASGHGFDFKDEDLLYLFIVVTVIALLIMYLKNLVDGFQFKIVAVALGVFLCVTLWGGVRALWFIINFDFDRGSLTPMVFSYLILLTFILANATILYGLLRNQLKNLNTNSSVEVPSVHLKHTLL